MTTVMQHAPGTFCWVELATTDQDAAKKFYSNLFGWTSTDTPIGPGQTYTIFQKNGRDVAALMTMMPEMKHAGMPPNWGSYVSVTSANAAAEHARKLGGKVMVEPMDVMEQGRMAVIQDPTGAIFSVWEAKEHIGVGVLDEPNSLCWFELVTPDSAKASAFYTQLFPWKAEKFPGPTDYTVMKRKDGTSAGGVFQITEEMKGTPPHWMLYFAVDNCDATCNKVQQAGGKVFMPAKDIPEVGRFAILQDPQGALFSILQPSPTARK